MRSIPTPARLLVLFTLIFLQLTPAAAETINADSPILEPGDRYDHFKPERRAGQKALEDRLLASAQDAPYARWHEALSSEPHVAGSEGDRKVIEFLAREMAAMGLEVERQELWLYLPHPVSAEVTILGEGGVGTALDLQEKPVEGDPYTEHPDLDFGWNAYSGSGSATGEVVFAGFGTKQDFEKLAEMGVDVTGKVVIARYGRNFRGYKAKFAEAAGAAALLIYIDPEDQGYAKGAMWPDGGWANETSIQRGSIMTLPWTGDPLTPFEPATRNAERLDPAEIDLPTIPVQPIPWAGARQILERMTGPVVPKDWQGALPLSYRLTGGPDLRVRVEVEQERKLTRTENVVGTLRGAKFPDEKIIVGCHHDAWSFGAGDPNAGTLVVLGAALGFAEEARRGKRPDRSLVFAHWAAEEFGILGSTEWVEAHRDDLADNAVAYLNLDMAAMGMNVRASASPSLRPLIAGAVQRADPEAYGTWRARAGTDDTGLPRTGDLGGGSDHVAFLTHAGIPSLSLSAGGSDGVSYHTNYEDLAWYREVVGADYASARMLTGIVDVALARLADADRLPLEPHVYGGDLQRHLVDLQKLADERGVRLEGDRFRAVWDRASYFATLGDLRHRLAHLPPALRSDKTEESWDDGELAEINRRLRTADRQWLAGEGIPDRPWFRSLFAAPDADSGYAPWMLPLLRHAVEAGDQAAVDRALARYGEALDRYAGHVGEDLSRAFAFADPPSSDPVAAQSPEEIAVFGAEPVDPDAEPEKIPAALLEESAGQDPEADGSMDDDGLPTLAEETAGLTLRPGLFDLWVDEEQGSVFVELTPPGRGEADDRQRARGELGTYLYTEGLVTGLGSNPVGLDRGQLGEGRIVTFRRLGGKVLLEEQNLRFRALTDDPLEADAVRESFAASVIWGAPVVAADPDGTVLVDFTPFLLQDAHGVIRTLRDTDQGSFRLVAEASAVDLNEVRAFPKNIELESVLTYRSDDPGDLVAATVPVAETFSLVQHHSFLELPDDDFEPREFDPRAGYFGVGFTDYSAPLDRPLERRFIARHRTEGGEPIVFYLDPGTPEPVRSALLDGARWWADAFEAAGLRRAYRVEMLPEGIHPLDARYHVIRWVHRSTRGWSYGGGVLDPRTGEIVKAYVLLGSLRVRQDRLLFEGLLGVGETGSGSARDPVELALARIRQLAAHEVGHALGLDHNFAASADGRNSVMDYPAPLVRPTADGGLDVSAAYGVGVGAWDRHAIRYGYGELPERPERRAAALDAVVREGIAAGLRFVADPDARPRSAAHPVGSLWDNGADPVAELNRVMAVREVALDRFGPGNLAEGRPLTLLQEVLVPIYLYHRYQIEAAAKVVGGVEFTYAVRGDGQTPVSTVPGDAQRRALAAVAAALDADALDLPDEVLAQIPPRAPGYGANRELFDGNAGPVLDPLAMAATAARLPVELLLEPHRAARLIDQHRRDETLPGLLEVQDALIDRAVGTPAQGLPGRLGEIHRTVQTVIVEGLLRLAADPAATPAVRARTELSLTRLREALWMEDDGLSATDHEHRIEAAHRSYLARWIDRYFERPGPPLPLPQTAPDLPPGSPIGG